MVVGDPCFAARSSGRCGGTAGRLVRARVSFVFVLTVDTARRCGVPMSAGVLAGLPALLALTFTLLGPWRVRVRTVVQRGSFRDVSVVIVALRSDRPRRATVEAPHAPRPVVRDGRYRRVERAFATIVRTQDERELGDAQRFGVASGCSCPLLSYLRGIRAVRGPAPGASARCATGSRTLEARPGSAFVMPRPCSATR